MSKNKYDILENLYEGVYFVDKERTITSWNNGATQLTGFSQDEVVHKKCFSNILNHVDVNGYIELINNICSQMTGWTVESARGLHYKEVFRLTHEDPNQVVSDPIEEVIRSNESREFTNHAILTSLNGVSLMIEDSA